MQEFLSQLAPSDVIYVSIRRQGKGKACQTSCRYVELFAEEVVRGGPAFAVSLTLSAVEPAVRIAADLGAWQLISPVSAVGRVLHVASLHEVQDEV